MIVIQKSGAMSSAIEYEIQSLKKLVQDMENIRNGHFPGYRALVRAPRIENWAVRYRSVPCLTGEISAHPELGNAKNGITSDLWILAPHHGFARTMSRYYALGEPLKTKIDKVSDDK